MGMMPGTNPVWYLFGTLLVVSVVLGVYILIRERLADALSTKPSADPADPEQGEAGGENTPRDRSIEDATAPPIDDASPTDPPSADSKALTVLPEDERRVVEPVLDTPGLTQVELRGRSDFSKAKVSQTVSELENRGLIYREKQGRTYRVYPGELLKEE